MIRYEEGGMREIKVLRKEELHIISFKTIMINLTKIKNKENYNEGD